MGIRPVRFCSGSLTLEGRLGEPDQSPRAGIVLCHPHPLYRGSMSSALIPALQRLLVAEGYAVLRFNFRGVGHSEGSFGDGEGEAEDAVAALDLLTSELPPATRLVGAGWSFGSVIALRAAIRHPRVVAACAIAPPFGRASSPDPPSPDAVREWGRPVLVIAGDDDDVSPAAAMTGWVESARASFVTIPGADHFFRRPEPVADAMLEFLRSYDVG